MIVRLAEHQGMCFGVRDAIGLALEVAGEGPVTILGDLVHNPDVVAQLDEAGAVRVRQLNQVETQAVLLTAHGVSNRVKLQLRLAGKEVHDATCPLVTRAHLALAKLVADGYFPVIVGQRDHVEVRGLAGDFDDHLVILNRADIVALARRFGGQPDARIGIVAQTTQTIEHVRAIVDEVKKQLPFAEIRFIDTVCQPTKDRQQSLRALTEETDVIVVVGGPESNNSRKLAEMARQLGKPAYRVSGVHELRREWFRGASVVGLTAGTSTPDNVIASVREWIEDLAD